jgi:hypothetical protein
MNFLATHECRIDFREFRNPHAEVARFPRLTLPNLSTPSQPPPGGEVKSDKSTEPQ